MNVRSHKFLYKCLSEGKNNKDGKSGFRDKNMTLKNNFSTF